MTAHHNFRGSFDDFAFHKLRLHDLSFSDHLPPSVNIFYGIKVYKKSIFLTTYPPPLVNVVCERPLVETLLVIFL